MIFTTGRSREYTRAEYSSIERANSGVIAARKSGPLFSLGGIGVDNGMEAMATADQMRCKCGKEWGTTSIKEWAFIYSRTWFIKLVEPEERG
jgi:hypothetical protein